MMDEPEEKYAMAFFDGQNLFRHAKDAFGHHHPNYDPIKLHAAVCETNGWLPNLVRFYTGVPDPARSPMWARYWNNRVIALKRSGVHVTTRKIRYREDHVDLPSGIRETVLTTQEKGIDVRLALDVISRARTKQFDVAVIYSQDQDFTEIVKEVKAISIQQDRWISIVSAFPVGSTATVERGINGAKWFKMDEAFYNACLDPHDYR
jgi:uncharacterized LabA/DUF88 family protein